MFAKGLIRSQIIVSALCIIIVLSSVCGIYLLGGFKRIDYLLYDLHFRWRGPIPTSQKVILVLMDDKSAVELNRKHGQWSREQTARALYNLTRAGAEIIGLDMIISDPDPNLDEDKTLAKAILECNNVVLARISSTQSGIERTSLPVFRSQAIGEGFIDVPLDVDDVWRRLRYFNATPLADGSLQFYPAFALELARTFLYIDFAVDSTDKNYVIVGRADSEHLHLPKPELLINFYGNYTVFPRISYSDVVNNRFDPDKVNGKIVLLGSSLAINKDKFFTPFSAFNWTGDKFKDRFKKQILEGTNQTDLGVACQAHALETILSQQFLISLTKAGQVALILACGVAGILFYLPALTIFWDYGILFVMVGATITASHLAFLKVFTVVDAAPLLCVIICQFVAGMVLQKGFLKKRAAMIHKMFGKYVSAGVANELIKGKIDISFTGKKQELTILFTDLKSFTTLSESLTAEKTSRLLNTYFGEMIPQVFNYQGTLDKLMGDAIMAFFGAPLPSENHPVQAARSALAMLDALENMKKTNLFPGIEKLDMGIGIHTGEVVVGNLGSREFIDYTVIGDPVNIAARLEGLKNTYSARIIISEDIADRLGDEFLLRELDLVRVKGKSRAVKIYELYSYKDRASQDEIKMIALFEAGLALFRCRQWEQAMTVFQDALDKIPDDGPALLYSKRAARYQQTPPGPEWDGVTAFDHK